jgi:hypothetical protein
MVITLKGVQTKDHPVPVREFLHRKVDALNIHINAAVINL